MTRALNIVWFKRDLRIADHRPLAMAIAAGPTLPLYIAEPELWAQPDASAKASPGTKPGSSASSDA